jgi:S-adenosylmethionine synthetase
MSINVNTFGTGVVADEKLAAVVTKLFDLRPAAIIEKLRLRRPVYLKTARYGHFGINDPEFTWEKTDMTAALRKAVGVA